MPNVNFKNFQQIGSLVTDIVKQATGRDPVQNLDMDYVSVEQNKHYVEVEVSGTVVSFTAGAEGLPIEKCVVQIEPIQSGTGDPSPENVRPISGWTECDVNRAGQNIEEVRVYRYILPNEVGTVYGGALTINGDGSGELVVDRAIVDLGKLAYWSKDNNRPGVFYTSAEAGLRKPNSKCVCSVYKGRELGVPSGGNIPLADNSISLYPSYGSGYIYVIDVAKAELTAEEFKTAVLGVKLVYELVTPVTYQLSNLEVIETLKGINNIWADTGDIEVKFKDLKELY